MVMSFDTVSPRRPHAEMERSHGDYYSKERDGLFTIYSFLSKFSVLTRCFRSADGVEWSASGPGKTVPTE